MMRDLDALGEHDLVTMVMRGEVGEVVTYVNDVVVLPIHVVLAAMEDGNLSPEAIALGVRETTTRLLPHGNTRLLAECLLTLARSLRTFQSPLAALDPIVMAVKILRELDEPNALGRAQLDLGVNLKDLVLLYEAIRALELAEAIFDGIGDQGGLAAALYHRSTICRRLGIHHEALELLDHARTILPDAPTARGWLRQMQMDRIQNLMQLDRRVEARNEIDGWLSASEEGDNYLAFPLAFLAEIEEREGDDEAALEHHCRAVTAAAGSVFGHRTIRFRDRERENLDFVFARSLHCATRTGQALLAFGLLELSRVGSVQLPAGTIHRDDRHEIDAKLEQALREKRDALVDEATSAVAMGSAQLSSVQARAEWLVGDHDFMTRDSFDPPRNREEVEALAHRVQANLPAGTLLLEYAWHDDSLSLFAVDERGFELFETGLDRFAVAMLTASFEEECLGLLPTDGLAQLGGALLDPAAPRIAEATDLVIVPTVGLAGVPFHALPYEGRPASEVRLIRLAPSGFSLFPITKRVRLNASASSLIVDVSDTAYADLDPLPHVANEAAMVAGHFEQPERRSGPGATAASLTACPDVQILHLACHGHYEEEAPLLSRLHLNDRPVFAFEIMLADVRAQLVVLSACETARGRRTLGGRSETLAAAFLKAGVDSVVATLWPLDDEVGGMLMHRFYAELLDEGSYQSPAEALRAAQLHVRSQPGFEHPYFWAPFAVYSPSIDRARR
jgi:tetratricopeptide (TPR) repeat protein